MSDTNIAPAAPSPSAPANEVAIDPNPVSMPTPLSGQPPEKPVSPDHKGSEHHPLSRREQTRETIRKAFDRSNIKAAEAKPGHNQPPEPTKAEKSPTPPPIDLKKRPDDQPQSRSRGEHGHFAPNLDAKSQAATSATSATSANTARPAQRPANPLPPNAPYRNPLPRMDQAAAAEWHKAPESVRASVTRMHHEFTKAYQALRADSEALNPIRHYHEKARRQGTTLAKALKNYDGMERKLRKDPIAGFDVITNNLNLRTPDGQKIGFRDICWHVVNQSPEQLQAVQFANAQAAQAAQLKQIQQRQQALEQDEQRRHHEAKFNQALSWVDRYAETHPRLDELSGAIQQELKFGFDLDTAYRRADALYPSHAAQTRNGSAPAQTRTSDRSIRGAPDGGPSGNGLHGKRNGKASSTVRGAVANALARVNGAL